jgi:hypothetical protein
MGIIELNGEFSSNPCLIARGYIKSLLMGETMEKS